MGTDWADVWRKRLAQQELARRKAMAGRVSIGPTGAGINDRAAGSTPGQATTGAASGIGSATSSSGIGALQGAFGAGNNVIGPSGDTGGSIGAATDVETAGVDPRTFPTGVAPGLSASFDVNQGDNASKAGPWADDLLPASILDLSRNPGLWNAMFADDRGYGYGMRGLLDQYLDPGAAFLLSLSNGAENTPENKLAFADSFLSNAATPGGTLNNGFAPTDVLNQIFGQSADPQNPIGSLLYGANLENPQAQVSETLKLIQGAMYGRVNDEVLGPYLAMLQREGQDFLVWKTKNPDSDNMTFGAWMNQRYGPNGGF
jgi:hypothetical protein